MNKLWLIVAVLALAGCTNSTIDDASWNVSTVKNRPIEVKIVPDPTQADRIKVLEARVTALEKWATKEGGKFK